jgi:ATP-dependent RNA helicase DeaD
MEGGSVWFRANVGRRKNAEARWLLPMICRRGGIDKNDIGAIRIYQGITEFEISGKAAESFAARVQGPDKDDIHIERMPDGPRGEQAADAGADAGKPRYEKPRYDKPRKHHDERFRERTSKPEKKAGSGAPFAKRPFGKKKKNKHRG